MTTKQRLARLAGWTGAAALLALAAAWGGVPAQASTTATETDYGRMILVLDSSGSMKEPAAGGTTKIQAAKDALGQVVDDLPDEADVGLRVFGAEVFSRDQKGACTDSQLVVEPGTDNRDALRTAVDGYRPYGETPIAYALQQAAHDIGAEGTRSIVLVSDGVATCPPDPCRVAASIAKRGIDLQIDVVGLSVDQQARAQLRCIAAAGNGTYYDARSADDIVESLDTAASRALRPFELEGLPLAGGPATDPTPVEVGRWVDEIGTDSESAERWFRFERSIPGSTVHVGITSLGGGDDLDSIGVEASSETGFCGNAADLKATVSGELIATGLPVGEHTAVIGEDCNDGPVLIKVARTIGIQDQPAPYSLSVVEEPPVEQVGSLPGSLDVFDAAYDRRSAPGGEATEVVGGSSFGEATEITDGSYTGTIVPGETQAFKIPVSYGEVLNARVVTPPADGKLGELLGLVGPNANLAIYNPLRVAVSQVGVGVAAGGQAAGSDSEEMTAATTEVRYLNRESPVNAAYLDGYYYVVYATDGDGGRSYEMPFTLQVHRTGEVSGEPTYADDGEIRTGEVVDAGDLSTDEPTSPPASETPAPDDESDDSSAPHDDTSGARLELVAAGGLGLVAVAAVTVGVLLLRRSGT